jgi:hypothetical protein
MTDKHAAQILQKKRIAVKEEPLRRRRLTDNNQPGGVRSVERGGYPPSPRRISPVCLFFVCLLFVRLYPSRSSMRIGPASTEPVSLSLLFLRL